MGIAGDARCWPTASTATPGLRPADPAAAGEFATGSGGYLHGMHVMEAGDVWVTDAIRPVLWHLTADQVAASSGAPASCPEPRDPVHRWAGQRRGRRRPERYAARGRQVRRRLALPHRPGPAGAAGAHDHPDNRRHRAAGQPDDPDGNRLVVADENGLSVVELSRRRLERHRGGAVARPLLPRHHRRGTGRRPVSGRQHRVERPPALHDLRACPSSPYRSPGRCRA